MPTTQGQKVIAKLLKDGHVSNFWAIEHNILRLGAVIFNLKKTGWKFDAGFGKNLGKPAGEWRNYYYFFKGRALKIKNEK